MEKLNFHIIEPNSAKMPEPKEERIGGKEYVNYGEDNLYPLFLSNIIENSPSLSACIDSLSDYVFAHGIEDKVSGEKIVNANGETFNEVLHNCVIDYISYGAFSMQMIGNEFGNVINVYHIDVRKVRLSEDGKKVYFNKKNWTKWNKETIVYDRFNGTKTKNCIFYFKRPTCRTFYGRPIWFPALKHSMTDVEIAKFHFASIVNNFAPSAVVNFNNGQPSEEVQDEIESKLTQKFTGTDNAARLLVSFNDDVTHATKLERLTEDNFDKKYDALAKSTRENILTAFRVSSALVGIMPEQTGFNSVEYESAFKIYKETVVKPIQQEIESAFKRVGINIKFSEFIIAFGNNNSETQEG